MQHKHHWEGTKDIFQIWLVWKADLLYNFILWVNHASGKHNTYMEMETDKTFRENKIYESSFKLIIP